MKNFFVLAIISIVSSILGSIIGISICSNGQGCPIGTRRKLKGWMRKVNEGVIFRKSRDLPARDQLTPIEGTESNRSRSYLRR
jgi:hypothetical protein